jgi:hypothetical protein
MHLRRSRGIYYRVGASLLSLPVGNSRRIPMPRPHETILHMLFAGVHEDSASLLRRTAAYGNGHRTFRSESPLFGSELS